MFNKYPCQFNGVIIYLFAMLLHDNCDLCKIISPPGVSRGVHSIPMEGLAFLNFLRKREDEGREGLCPTLGEG